MKSIFLTVNPILRGMCGSWSFQCFIKYSPIGMQTMKAIAGTIKPIIPPIITPIAGSVTVFELAAYNYFRRVMGVPIKVNRMDAT